MTSELTLIYNSPLLPERNFHVPSLSDAYDSEYGSNRIIISNFQYVKHSLDLTIKIDEVQQWGLEYENSQNINYLIVQHKDGDEDVGQPVGYFVTNKRWIAKSTIELTLHCDVINSFIDRCELSPKTRILRQHKDRFNIPEYSLYDHIEDIFSVAQYLDNDGFGFGWSGQNPPLFQRSEEVALFDLTADAPSCHDEDDDIIYADIRIKINEFVNCRFYFADADGKIISQITNSTYTDKELMIYYNRYGHALRVRLFNGVNNPISDYINIPSNAKNIVLRMTKVDAQDVGDCLVIAEIFNYDEYTEEQYDELVASYHISIFDKTADFVEGYIPPSAYATIKIDQYSEGITPMLFGRWERYIEESDRMIRKDWYLIYMNQNNEITSMDNPVDVFLVPSDSVKIQAVATYTGTFTGVSMIQKLCEVSGVTPLNFYEFETNTYFYFTAQNNPNGRIQITGTQLDEQASDVDVNLTDYNMVIIGLGSRDWPIVVSIINKYGEYVEYVHYFKDDASITFTNCKYPTMKETNVAGIVLSSSKATNLPVYNLFNIGTGSVSILYGIDQINRTDPKIIKIIKLPYSPMRVGTLPTGEMSYDATTWSFDSVNHVLKLLKYSTSLSRYLEFNDDVELNGINPYYPLVERHYIGGIVDRKNAGKSYLNEPKLYHSDYYQPKVIYDSFSFTFQLELINYADNLHHFVIKYDVSNTCNSRFMFTFENYTTAFWDMRDYNNIMIVSRNNEIAIFNQQYLNYLRAGYNYDRKANELLYEQAGINEIGKVISQSLSFIPNALNGKGSIGSNVANLGIKGGIMAMGFALDNYNMAFDYSMREMQIAAKRAQLMNQATGVIDANDVDLMSVYTNNRLKYKLYQVSEKMQKVLFDLFYYNGYVAEVDGIPDTTSRIRFNFVQAEIVLKKVPNLPTNIVNEIKDKYAEGITFMHKFEGEFDWNQELENWESKFFD